MELLTKFPLTNDEIAEMGQGRPVFFPASFDEYWEVLENAEFKTDYFDHQIIATMSYETDLHSKIATKFTSALDKIFGENPKFSIFNSNRPVFIQGCQGSSTGVFNADGMLVDQPSKLYEYRPGMTAETTPSLLIEVLSPTTREHDFGNKLPCYKNIPSLRFIIFAESNQPKIYFMERTGPEQWTETVFTQKTDVLKLDGGNIPLEKIYQDLYF